MSKTATSEFSRLDGLRASYLSRAEKHSGYTLPRVCPPSNYNVNNDSLTHDFQSVGAQSTNHLVNRLMLTMFAPSRPFIRLALTRKARAEVLAAGIKEADVDAGLAQGERDALAEIDNRPLRPKLFEHLTQLVIVGDSLLRLPQDDDEDIAHYGIRDYVMRRTPGGKISTLIVREKYAVDSLAPEAQALWLAHKPGAKGTDEVDLFHYVERTGRETLRDSTWIADLPLGGNFITTYTDDTCPWIATTWHLKRGQHYGTGIVEDYSGDFAALSALSEAQVKGAILASEFRWLVNPSGITKPEDLEASENGATLPGVEGDVILVANSKSGDLQVIRTIGEDYIRRIGHGFLLNSAMTRDAERVTAEEIRAQAMELETGLGGVYTRLSLSLQSPVARWALASADIKLGETKIEFKIITGLDALSRNGDLAALRAALADIAALQNLGPLVDRLDTQAIMTTIFTGHGVPADKYVLTAEQLAAKQEAQNQQHAVEANTEAAAKSMEKPPQ